MGSGDLVPLELLMFRPRKTKICKGRRLKYPYLRSEALEPRIVLDGDGAEGVLPFFVADADPGEDPHVDVVGAGASEIDFAGDYAYIDSFIDHADDVDVFQVDSTGDAIQVSGEVISEDAEAEVHVFDVDGNEVAPIDEATDTGLVSDPGGFIECDSTFEFCDLFPTEPNQTYYISVGGVPRNAFANDFVDDLPAEYLFEIRRSTTPRGVPMGGNPDSDFGVDVHAETRSRSATLLDLSDSFQVVDSFIDSEDDIDVFRFRAQSDFGTIASTTFDDSFRAAIDVHDVDGNLVASNSVDWLDGPLPELILEVLEPGQHYFVSVSSFDAGTTGEYSLDISHVAPSVQEGPDSEFGSDVHGRRIATATPIEFSFDASGLGENQVHSYLDYATDIDAFRIVAEGDVLSAFAYSPDGSVGLSLRIFDQNAQLVVDSDVGRGDADVDFSPSVFAEVEPGQVYFLVAMSFDGRAGEYILESQQLGFTHPDVASPDGRFGIDVHADTLNADATELFFQAIEFDGASDGVTASVDSFVDSPLDVDTFRFTAESDKVTVSGYAWNQNLDYFVSLYDRQSNLLARTKIDSSNAFSNLELPVRQGQTYFMAVHGANGSAGEYVVNLHQFVDTVDLNFSLAPDAEFGSDQHVDVLGLDATTLIGSPTGTQVVSFADSPDDVDVFQFVGTGGLGFAALRQLTGDGTMAVAVSDSSGLLVSSPGQFGFMPDAKHFELWETIAGETYYLAVAAESRGMYQLDLAVESLDDTATGEQLIRDRLNQRLAALADIAHSHDRNGYLGDTNFDGSVDASDFNVWHTNRFTAGSGPESGDFNEDGFVDVRDFNIWNQNAFTAQAVVVARRAAPAAPASAGIDGSPTVEIASPVIVEESNRKVSFDRPTRAESVVENEANELAPSETRQTSGMQARRRSAYRRGPKPTQTQPTSRTKIDQIFANLEEL